jgi:hypothetical protein
VACCPGNITRFLASVPGYVYAQSGDKLYVNLFVASDSEIKLDNGSVVKLKQETRYPWDGAVKMTVDPGQAAEFTLNVRIPGWARNEPAPGDLYHYAGKFSGQATLKVNGQAVPVKLEKGYAAVSRSWKPGDTVELDLPMPIRRIAANPNVDADRNRLALQRGPLVYAAEWPDNPNKDVRNIMLPENAKLTAEFRPDMLKGVTVIKGRSVGLAKDAKGAIKKTEQDFVAIPYYTWANRGRGPMAVWLPTVEGAAKPTPYPTLSTMSTVTVSGRETRRIPANINDGEDPPSSNDMSAHYDWGPRRGEAQWAEMAFPKATEVSQVELYWFDDSGRGQVRVPASWRVLYQDGNQWKPIETQDAYGVATDQYNKVTFKPVTTPALSVEITAQPEFAVGVQEWKVK